MIKDETTHFFYVNILPFHEDYREFSFAGFETIPAFQPNGAAGLSASARWPAASSCSAQVLRPARSAPSFRLWTSTPPT